MRAAGFGTLTAVTFGGLVLTTACTPPPAITDAGPTDAGTVEPAADPVGFVAVDVITARVGHTLTALPAGGAVAIGGEDASARLIGSAAVLGPDGAVTREIELPSAIANHAAVLLNDGRVLVAGGGASSDRRYPFSDARAEAFVLDPTSFEFSAVAPLHTARSHAVAVRLRSGAVLVVGGGAGVVQPDNYLADALSAAEVYDPAEDAWHDVGSMAQPRYFHTATLLADGRVLVVGGVDENELSFTSAELFDPSTETWSSAGDVLGDDRFRHAAAPFGAGALIAGGKKSNVRFNRDVQQFDPQAVTFTARGDLPSGGNGMDMVQLQSGNVLVLGGYGRFAVDEPYQAYGDALIVDADAITPIEPLVFARSLHKSALLSDGRVLVTGGIDTDGVLLDTVEISTLPE